MSMVSWKGWLSGLLLFVPVSPLTAQTTPTYTRIVTPSTSHMGTLLEPTPGCINLYSTPLGRHCVPVDSVRKAYIAVDMRRNYGSASLKYGLVGIAIGTLLSLAASDSEEGDLCDRSCEVVIWVGLAGSLGSGIGYLVTALKPPRPVWKETDPAALQHDRPSLPSIGVGLRVRF